MRTTLELDAALIRKYAFEWRPVAGGGRARVDLDDRDTLWTRMEGSE